MFVLRRIHSLYFMSAAEVNATVTAFGIAELDVQFKILKLLFGNQIDSGPRVDQYTVFYLPLVFSGDFPSLQVLSVEQFDRFAPGRFGATFHVWGFYALPTVCLSGRRGNRAFNGAACQLS